MKNSKIRPAVQTDLEKIEAIYAYARHFMAENGNPTQWVNGYPQKELLEEDIRRGRLYVAECDDEIYGVFLFEIGEDPTYGDIDNGNWISGLPYGTIHRIASCKSGLFSQALEFCRGRCSHIRMDTHADNKPMQHLAEKYGFTRCGIIYTGDGSPRIAYELL